MLGAVRHFTTKYLMRIALERDGPKSVSKSREKMLASSDYGFLKHGSFVPRPNYFAVWLWNRLMGTTVYDCENPNTEGAHIYCHSRRDGKESVIFLVINNSLTEATTVHLPKQTQQEGNIELIPESCTFFVL